MLSLIVFPSEDYNTRKLEIEYYSPNNKTLILSINSSGENNMSGSLKMYLHSCTGKDLSDFELHMLCGAIVHNAPFDQPLAREKFVEPILETQFELNVVPQEPIIRLSKKEHVDAFFESGQLRLGCFNQYVKSENTEVGDDQEGTTTLLAKTKEFGVIAGKYGSGFNQYVLCTYLGIPDREIMEKFGYDSGFIINDPIGFSKAIAESINATSSTFGKCIYHPHKAVLGFPKDANPYKLSHESGKIVTAAQYFIKPERYSHQKEFRFLWEQHSNINEPKIFDCSPARQYCSRIDTAHIMNQL